MLLPMRVLFLCTGNSCRSQMAEGWARSMWPEGLEAVSAGTKPHGLDPRAIEVMAEAGIDISVQSSQHLDEFPLDELDHVVTVCDSASQSCPAPPPGVQVTHAPFDDPPRLARELEDPTDVMAAYRRVRDEIRSFVERFGRDQSPGQDGA